jgi:hypothetical protein
MKPEPKKYDHSRSKTQTAFLSIIKTGKGCEWIGEVLKIGSTGILSQNIRPSQNREDYHRKQCCC